MARCKPCNDTSNQVLYDTKCSEQNQLHNLSKITYHCLVDGSSLDDSTDESNGCRNTKAIKTAKPISCPTRIESPQKSGTEKYSICGADEN